MSLQWRWTLALLAAAILLLGGVAWFLDASLRRQEGESRVAWEERQQRELMARLESFGADASRSLEQAARSDALASLLVEALRQGQAGRRPVTTWAATEAPRFGLDLLAVLRGDGTILTHSTWPASHGLPHPLHLRLARAVAAPVLVWEGQAPEEGEAPWYVGAVRPVDFDGEELLVVGGRALSPEALAVLRDRADVARLEMGLALGDLRLALVPPTWHVEGRLPLVYEAAPDPTTEALQPVRRRLLGLTLLSLILVAVAAPAVAGGLVRPLHRLQRAVGELEQGERRIEIPLQGPSEVRLLGAALQDLASSLEASEAAARAAQRRAAWREMARHLAHELKNALSPLTLALDNVETAVRRDDEVGRGVLARSLETARDQLTSLDRLVGEFRDFARTPGLELRPADALSIGRAAVASAAQAHPETPFGLEETQPVGDLQADPEQLRRALHNLLINAAEAAPGRPVTLAVGGGPGRDRWWVAVRDEGPGLPEEIAAHWGEPYHTTREGGTGLGLTVALQVVEAHGGRLEARPRPGGGLEVFASLHRRPRVVEPSEET